MNSKLQIVPISKAVCACLYRIMLGWMEFKSQCCTSEASVIVELHGCTLFVAIGVDHDGDDDAHEWARALAARFPGARLACWGAGRCAALEFPDEAQPQRVLNQLLHFE